MKAKECLLVVALLLGGTLLGGLLILSRPSNDGLLSLFLVFALAILFLKTPWSFLRKQRIDVFHPLVLPALLYFFPFYVLRNLYLVLTHTPIPGLAELGSPISWFNAALAYTLLGYFCFLIGYKLGGRVGWGRKLPAMDGFDLRPHAVVLPCLGFYAVGASLAIFLLSKGVGTWAVYFGDLTLIQLLIRISDVRLFALFILVYTWSRWGNERTGGVVALACVLLLAVELILTFLSGGRSQLFLVGLFLFAGQHYGRLHQKPALFKYYFRAGCALLLALLFGVIVGNQFRDTKFYSYGRSSPVPVSELSEFAANVVSGTAADVGELTGRTLESFVRRLDSTENLALILALADDSKELERSMGMENNIVKELAWSLIPRFVYPHKPVVGDIGQKFGAVYRGTHPNEHTSMAQTMVGDLYRNFRTAGVILGMMLLGVILRVVYVWLIEDRKPTGTEALVFILIMTRVGWESGYTNLFTQGLRLLPSLLVFIFVLKIFAGYRIRPAASGLPRGLGSIRSHPLHQQ